MNTTMNTDTKFIVLIDNVPHLVKLTVEKGWVLCQHTSKKEWVILHTISYTQMKAYRKHRIPHHWGAVLDPVNKCYIKILRL